MRKLTDHILNGLNEALTINVLDEPGNGGANHEYEICGFKRPAEFLFKGETYPGIQDAVRINFQNGPIQEAGVNGISGEALIAIQIDRLRCFQKGEYACRENAIALTHLEDALMWLQKRTRDRMARGVEGTHKK